MKPHKKRIFFFLPFMNGGGAERVVLTLLTHLDKTKFEPTLVLLKKEGRYLPLVPKDIKIIDLQVTQARYALFKIVQLVKKEKPDIIFTTLAYLNLIIALIIPLFKNSVMFIARESNTVSVRNKREKYPKIFDWLYRNIYKNFHHIVTQAEAMREDLQKNYKIPVSKMQIIYNPVDSNYIRSMSLKKSELLPKTKYNLLAVGRLDYEKGFDLLLQSISQLDESYHLTILGEGEEKETLLLQTKALKLENQVTFAGFTDNPYAYMKEADLLVLSSRYEGLPNVILEANCCGTPVVAYDSAGGTGEIVHDGENGYLVPPFDTVLFAKTIEKARHHTFDSQTIAQHTEELFGIDKVIQKYENLFLS
jgi:glycosyltransferase involved in cell wall biosynthesis